MRSVGVTLHSSGSALTPTLSTHAEGPPPVTRHVIVRRLFQVTRLQRARYDVAGNITCHIRVRRLS